MGLTLLVESVCEWAYETMCRIARPALSYRYGVWTYVMLCGKQKEIYVRCTTTRLVPEPSTRATPHKFSAPVANQFLTRAV